MTDGPHEMSDMELDKLLSAASEPELPQNFEARFAQKLGAERGNNVIAFPGKKRVVPRSAMYWPLGAALAASLVFGIWLGTSEQVQNLYPSSLSIAALSTTDDVSSDDFMSIPEDTQS